MTPDELRARLAGYGQAWDDLDVQPLVDRLRAALRGLSEDADEAPRIDDLAHRIDYPPAQSAVGPPHVDDDEALLELNSALDGQLHNVRRALEAEAGSVSSVEPPGRVEERAQAKELNLVGESPTGGTPAVRTSVGYYQEGTGIRQLGSDLWTAVGGDGLDVLYQPKVEMATGIIHGAEALLHWDHPRLGRVRPSELVTVAERIGAIRPLTLWVIQHALGQCRAWRDAGWDLSVAVNLSSRNLVDRRLASDVARLLEEIGVPATSLTVEITETMMINQWQRSLDILQSLVDLGVTISCDHFGTGNASLARLRRCPFHELKIDRSFIARITEDDTDRAITRSVLSLARGLGMSVVANGVEDQDAWDILRAFGCDQAQGFFISPPLHPDKFREWMAKQPASARPLLAQGSQDPTPGAARQPSR